VVAVKRVRFASVLAVAVLGVALTGVCHRPALSSGDGAAAPTPSVTGSAPITSALGAKDASAGAPPSDTRPPKDFFSDQLLLTLAREASATVVCRLLGLTDVFAERREPDVFFDVACEVVQVVRRPRRALDGTPLHFIWQVERGSRMPVPQSELLVYLKARKEPFDGPPSVKWVALDTGVMRYTPALQEKIRGMTRKKK
jgi:hypothetical protein